jgi:hypothetical protein
MTAVNVMSARHRSTRGIERICSAHGSINRSGSALACPQKDAVATANCCVTSTAPVRVRLSDCIPPQPR